jgi:hypothetical protein
MRFEDRPEIAVVSQGTMVTLQVGNRRGEVIGVLEAQHVVELANEILMRRARPTPHSGQAPLGDWYGPTHSRRG